MLTFLPQINLKIYYQNKQVPGSFKKTTVKRSNTRIDKLVWDNLVNLVSNDFTERCDKSEWYEKFLGQRLTKCEELKRKEFHN